MAKLPDERVVLVTSDRESTPESMRVYLGTPGKMRELELILADSVRDGGSLEVHTDAGSFFFPNGASANTPGARASVAYRLLSSLDAPALRTREAATQ